jgi:hypothetical protein
VGPTVRLHLVSASGETADGRHGSVRSAALEVGLVAGARVGIVPALALDAAVVLGWIIAPGRLLLGGREAFELGSLGFAIRLGFSSPGLQPEHPLGAPSGE